MSMLKTQLLTMIKQYLTVYPNVNIEIIHNDMEAILHLLAGVWWRKAGIMHLSQQVLAYQC